VDRLARRRSTTLASILPGFAAVLAKFTAILTSFAQPEFDLAPGQFLVAFEQTFLSGLSGSLVTALPLQLGQLARQRALLSENVRRTICIAPVVAQVAPVITPVTTIIAEFSPLAGGISGRVAALPTIAAYLSPVTAQLTPIAPDLALGTARPGRVFPQVTAQLGRDALFGLFARGRITRRACLAPVCNQIRKSIEIGTIIRQRPSILTQLTAILRALGPIALFVPRLSAVRQHQEGRRHRGHDSPFSAVPHLDTLLVRAVGFGCRASPPRAQ
jgi:hypothetical protein